MKRKHTLSMAVLGLLLVVSPLLFTGCHGSKGYDAFEIPETFDETQEYEITFWAKNDKNKSQTDIYNETIARFEAIYPNIHVNMRLYSDYSVIYNDVITNISTGTTPNVCITYPDHIATFMTGTNVVVPLDALMSDARYGLGGSEVRFDAPSQEEIIGKFLAECEIEGAHYALPFMRSTEALYINKTYVEELGYELPEELTWDFVWEVSEAALEKDGDDNFKLNGQKVMIPFIYKSTDNMMISYLYQKGAAYSDDAGHALLFNDTTTAFLEEIREHAASGAFSTFKISSYPANFLCAGQCVFAIDSTAGATWMGTNAPHSDISADKVVEFETAVRMIPQADPDNRKMMSQGPSVCVFNKKDPGEVLASWLFAQFLLNDETQMAYSETEGYVPVTLKARERAEYIDYLSRAGEDNDTYYDIKIEAAKLLLSHTDDTFVTPVFNGSTSLRDAAGQLVEEVVKSVRRKENVDSAYIAALYDNMRTLYRLDETAAAGAAMEDDLGALPRASVVLLIALGIAWIGIAAVFLLRLKKSRQR